MSHVTPVNGCVRAFYSDNIPHFLTQSRDEIFGKIAAHDHSHETNILQRNTWLKEIDILKEQLKGLTEGRILFEYTIPRMGKRIDAVILYKNIVYLLEFKCGDTEYKAATYDQVYDYALDLRNFQKESHNKLLVCIMVSDKAPLKALEVRENHRIIEPIACNAANIRQAISGVAEQYTEQDFDYLQWEYSEYLPTPTIIEAAQALYQGHNVRDITRNDAEATNLSVTTKEIDNIIAYSKEHRRKSICFVTGVPGAGKTLVGLNIAINHSHAQAGEHAVFLSGNQPLVTVLQEALARDKILQKKLSNIKISKKDALRETSAFIQIIHKYRDSFVGNTNLPPERIVIFDEAQRAWTHAQIEKFMSQKKGIADFSYSEPEFLISTMDRHQDWAVIICLIGGGQEINTGEAGLPEWFTALQRSFRHWDVYVTPQIQDKEYLMGHSRQSMEKGLNIIEKRGLHLAASVRSFRTPNLSAFIKALLDIDINSAKELYKTFKDKYPILLTRNLNKAKEWVTQISKGSTRYGLLAASGALRLKPEGIYVKNEASVDNWFLNGKEDVRSSYAMEDVVTEFAVQGLELDYTIVAWDADLRFCNGSWSYNRFVGTNWQMLHDTEKQLYLKNAYRVLLTRARQGMVIFVPEGSDKDATRTPDYYNGTYTYLRSLGIEEL